jgi:GT2 family glycosyltransferase
VKLWASILHWGSAADTWAAIASLQSSERPPDGILVIDNAAPEPLDSARAAAGGLVLLREASNLGFAAGHNRAIREALGRGADAVLLLNNDATLTPRALGLLEEAVSADPAIGIAAPVIRDAAPPHRIQSAGIRFDLRTGRMRLRHHGAGTLPPGPEIEDVDAVSGAALLATRRALDRAGLLRPEYFCYFEEVDWCLRAAATGARVVVLARAEARHRADAGAAKGAYGELAAYYAARNHLRCLRRNAPRDGIAGALRTGRVAALNALHALRGPGRRARLAAVREGIRDGRRGVFGPRPDHPGARPAPLLPGRAIKVAAVVLAWNRLEDTLECLESLFAAKTPGLDVILVDNASREPVPDAARRRFPGLRVIENAENLGYAGGNNVGIRDALARGADYVLVLNNDAVVTPDAIDELVRLAELDPEVGAVGARVMQYEARDRIYGVLGTLIWLPPLIRLEGLHEGGPEAPRAAGADKRLCADFLRPRDGDFVPGCSILFRRAALERVGLFDERFFAYHEDVDWCTRAWENGWRVSYLPSAVVYHRGAIHYGTSPVADYRYYFYGRNAVLYARKHATAGQMARLLASSALWLAGSVARRMVRGEPPPLVFRTAGLIARGMADGWRGAGPRLERIGLR